jgi:hypothetical protein
MEKFKINKRPRRNSDIFYDVTGWRLIEHINYNEINGDGGYYVGEGLYVHPKCEEFLTAEELAEFDANPENFA